MNRKLIGIISSVFLILVLAVVPLMSACKATVPTGELIAIVPTLYQEVWNLDVGGTNDRYYLLPTNENLYAKTMEGQEKVVQPRLAKSWEMSADGLTWDFYLREGIQFHDGWGEFTAEDVEFSFQQIGSPGSTNSSAALFRIGDGGNVVSYEVVSTYHFRMHLVAPDMRLEHDFYGADVLMLSKRYYESVGHDVAMQHPIGTGPWRFIEHVPSEYIKYEAVENHWRVTPEFKYLKIVGVPELSTRLAMLKTGAADISTMPIERKAEVEAAGLRTEGYETGQISLMLGGNFPPETEGYDPNYPWVWRQDEPEAYYNWDTGKIVEGSEWNTRALKVRMAMMMAINYDAIIDVIFEGEAVRVPLGYWRPFESIYSRPEWEPIAYDPARARQLLAEADYADGFELTIDMGTWASQPRIRDVDEAIARDWEAIGLKVNRWTVDYAVYRPLWLNRDNEGHVLIVPWQYFHPWMSYQICFYTPSGWNEGMESPLLDPIVAKSFQTIDSDERVEATRVLGDWFRARFFNTGIVLSNNLMVIGPKVADIPITAEGFSHYPEMTYEFATRAD